MRRLMLIISGLVSLALGMLHTVPEAAAQEQIALRVLAEQRVELLPQGRLCWTVNVNTLPPGSRNPLVDYHAHGLNLVYHAGGSPMRLEYAGGPARTSGAGEGWFSGQDNWHAHVNTGSTAITAVIFALTCAGPIPQPAGTRLARTEPAPLPGIRSGPVPYVARLIEGTGGPGAQYPVHVHAGPETVYVLEGNLAISMATGVTQHKAGDLLVIPPETPHQPTAVGNTPVRFLVAALTPVPEPHLRLLPDVRLPKPGAGPTALPRTGDRFSSAGPLALLVGTVLLAAGIGIRTRRV